MADFFNDDEDFFDNDDNTQDQNLFYENKA